MLFHNCCWCCHPPRRLCEARRPPAPPNSPSYPSNIFKLGNIARNRNRIEGRVSEASILLAVVVYLLLLFPYYWVQGILGDDGSSRIDTCSSRTCVSPLLPCRRHEALLC